MISLLSPRLLIALVLVAVLGVSHFSMYRKGRGDGRQAIQNEIQAQTIAATAEARRLEQKRQDAADGAARLAAQREAGIRADAARALRSVDGLRNDLDAIQRASADSLATANAAVRTLGDVLQSCTAESQRVAEEADLATSEALELRQAWPK